LFLAKKKDKEKRSPNVVRLANWFNTISFLIAQDILQPDSETRTKAIERWLLVAAKCKKINNFNSLMEVLAALGMSCISRLKKSWKALPENVSSQYEELDNIMDMNKNYKSYRRELEKATSANSPCVPYVGVILRDLLFIEEGNADTHEESGFVNFEKMRLVAAVTSYMQSFQRRPYPIKPIPNIIAFFYEISESGRLVRNRSERAPTEETLFQLSRKLEPGSLQDSQK